MNFSLRVQHSTSSLWIIMLNFLKMDCTDDQKYNLDIDMVPSSRCCWKDIVAEVSCFLNAILRHHMVSQHLFHQVQGHCCVGCWNGANSRLHEPLTEHSSASHCTKNLGRARQRPQILQLPHKISIYSPSAPG